MYQCNQLRLCQLWAKGGDVCRVVLSEKKRALSLSWFSSPWMTNLSAIYFSEGPWLTFLDFWESISDEVISYLLEGHALLAFLVTAFLSFLVVATDSFQLFCVYHFSSQLSELVLKSLGERMDDVNAPLRNWRIKGDNPRVKRYFWIPGAHSGHTQVPGFGRAWAIEAPEEWRLFLKCHKVREQAIC